MAEEDGVKIDKEVFHDRLSGFIAAWKNDKRSGDALFAGASTLAIIMGKTNEDQGYQKNNAFQVSRLEASWVQLAGLIC